MSPRSVLLVLILAACKKDEPKSDPITEVLESKMAGVVVGTGVGGLSEVHVPVHAINSFGAMISTGSISLSAENSPMDATSITPTADGWGEAVLRPGAPGAFKVTAAVAAGTMDGYGYAVEGAPGQVEFATMASHGQADFMANAGNGIVWAVGSDLWWGVPGGNPPQKVLALEEPVRSMFAVQADSDGNTDLMVQTGTMVLLLKGLDQGGLAWGTGFKAKDQVVGATVTDLNGDKNADLLIATVDNDTTAIAWMIGDGLWTFTEESVLTTDYAALGVSAEDFNDDNQAEVTVLTGDGLLRRYALFDGDWLAATTIDYELGLGEGAQMAPSTDVNGDRIPDIIAWGPTREGNGSQAWIVTAGASQPTRFRLFEPDNLPEYIGLAIGQLTVDGIQDVAMVTDTQLVRVTWKPKEPLQTPTIFVTTGVPVGHSLAIGSFAGDALPDVVIGSDELVVLPGAETLDDVNTTDKDESVPWRIQTPAAQSFDIGLAATPWVGDFNGDEIVDVVATIQADTSVGIRAYVGHPESSEGNESLVAGPLIPLASAGTPLGLAVCDTTVHVLMDVGVPTLYRYTVSTSGVLTEAMEPIEVPGGALVACGAFSGGDVAVANPSGRVTYVDAVGNVNEGETSAGATAIAARDADGDGVYTLEQCSETDCQMVSGDLDGVGGDDLARLFGGTLTVDSDGKQYTALEGGKGLWAGDVDGDGVGDLVVGESAYWRTYRIVPGGITPEDGHYLWRPAGDHPAFGDLDGNGVPDLIVAAAVDTDTSDAVDWTGQLLYSEAADR